MAMSNDFADEFPAENSRKLFAHVVIEEIRFRNMVSEEFPIELNDEVIRNEISLEDEDEETPEFQDE